MADSPAFPSSAEQLLAGHVENTPLAVVEWDHNVRLARWNAQAERVFGWSAAPALAGGRVPLLLHLLSPARRPAAVTADLPSFWTTGYPQVRAELRGRYPKHAWPEDPTDEPPTRGVRRPTTR